MSHETDTSPGPLERPRRQWLRTVLLGSIILLCGALIGSVLTTHVLWGRFLDHTRHHERTSRRIADRMSRDLDLTDEQAKKIHQIMTKRGEALFVIHREVRPRVEAELEQMRLEVDSVLTPEQAKRWNRRFKRMHEFWISDRPGLPHGRGRPGRPGHGRKPGRYADERPPWQRGHPDSSSTQPTDSL